MTSVRDELAHGETERGGPLSRRIVPTAGAPRRGRYVPPRLTRWGTIQELTRGGQASFDDYPSTGGSGGV